MRGLILQGETLGQKHQYYNKLLTEITIKKTSQEIKKIDYCDPDIDNLFKIDIACNKKDVAYVLEVLKCEDMLYVSKALKQSLWLINDTKYADIINPEYLHTQLLPQMTSKAGHKLILTIRLHLTDESRNEQFYKYYDEKIDLQTALKWLPNCSISFIEDVVKKNAANIPGSLIKRLCKKSITILEIFADNMNIDKRRLLSNAMFFLKSDTDRFISIIDSQQKYDIPKLSPKATQMIMKTKPEIILDNFEKFAYKINIPTFIKFLKSEDIQEFLRKHFKNDNLKSWFTFETIKRFVFGMPSDSRFDFIKSVFIEKAWDISGGTGNVLNDVQYSSRKLHCGSQGVPQYKWYIFAPFSIAFTNLKRVISLESNPAERNEIFKVLMSCAGEDSHNLHTILQYYRDKHLNEPFKFKSHFVNIILSMSNSHRFDDKTWTTLNDIFCTMEVYSESNNNVQLYLKHIIVYKLVHGATLPNIVEKKFVFDTMKSFQSKLNDEEKSKIFNYLYEFMTNKIQNITINSESDLKIIKEHIVSVLNLLSDWSKNLINHSIILEKIREVIKIKVEKSWSEDLSDIYNINKSWRKYMFKESVFLHPTQEVCVNALKHEPELILLSRNNICLNDSINITRLLSKLRIYWPETLAKAFIDTFRNQLDNIHTHKISIRSLCVLLQKDQLTDILNNYKPNDKKINWTETSDLSLSIQKCFAKYMYLARPHPPVQVVLLYAKGDYLQFVLPSVHSILGNISSDQSIKYLPMLLDAPVSLQKHGINIACAKLKIDEFLLTSLNIWKSSKNPSIRATIFKLIFKSLCKEQNENNIKEIWYILDTFIDTLTADENQIIYHTLGQAKQVPLSVKQAYCMKSYRFLKSLPPKMNCDKLVASIVSSTVDLMEFIDIEFAVEIIFDSLNKKKNEKYYTSTTGAKITSACLLSTKCEAIQTQRYEKIFTPLLKKHLTDLKDAGNNQFQLKFNFNEVLQGLLENVKSITINNNMITPIKLFNDIHNDLKEHLSSEDNYVLMTTWKLAAKHMQLIDKYRVLVADIPAETVSKNEDLKIDIIYLKAAPDFGKFCMKQLQEEISEYFPSIYRLFSKALNNIFTQLNFNPNIILATLKEIQKYADIIEGHLLVLKNIPYYLYDSKDKEERSNLFVVLASHRSAEVRMAYHEKYKILLLNNF